MNESAAVGRLLHTRHVTCQGFVRDDGDIEIEASLRDISIEGTPLLMKRLQPGEAIHEMRVLMVLQKDLVIRSVSAVIDTAPTPQCRQAAVVYESLIGLRIGPGFLRSAKERISTTSGCTHLSDLLKTIATTAQQTYFALRRVQSSPAEQVSELVDTCYAHRAGGMVSRLVKGAI